MAGKDCCGKAPESKILLPMAPESACSQIREQTQAPPPGLDQPFLEGVWEAGTVKVPRVTSDLRWPDHWGTIKARWGMGRMSFTVDPGLYALGEPDKNAPVLVTANYKMSFDRLREALPGRNAWVLVLDTKGINVWCAAGKGTFGTDELVFRIAASGLKDMVAHRNLILPQLGAPGIAAHLVKKLSGFKVHYGPVAARDLPAYLDAGMKATPAMRTKTFPLRERFVLIPIELVASFKAALVIMLALLMISGLTGHNSFLNNVMHEGLFTALAIAGAVAAGVVLHPILLPYLPGRAFSTKGFFIGILMFAFLYILWGNDISSWRGFFEGSAWMLMTSSIAAYLAMNFTGASTYTSLSGVKKEMRWALPLEIGTGLSGFGLWLVSRFIF